MSEMRDLHQEMEIIKNEASSLVVIFMLFLLRKCRALDNFSSPYSRKQRRPHDYLLP